MTKSFFRKIRHFFRKDEETQVEDQEENEEEKKEVELIFRKKSKWTPPKVHHTVETFIEAVKTDILSSPKVPLPKNNLSKSEIKAMNDLKDRSDILITKADKWGSSCNNGCQGLYQRSKQAIR